MSFTSWGSGGTVSSSSFEDWGSSSWRHRFPDNSGTKDPRTDPERVQRIAYLEREVYQMEDAVRQADYNLDQAKRRVDELKNELSRTRDEAYRAREQHLELGKKVAGLQGKQAGNKERIRVLEEKLRYATDTWTINDIKNELAQRQNDRWTIADEISRTTDAYRSATDRMNTLESRTNELSRELDSANDNVWRVQDDNRAKKERLAEFKAELSRLKNG